MEKEIVVLYKEVDSKLLAKKSATFLFEGCILNSYKKNNKESMLLDLNQKKTYTCMCKYLNKTYAYVITDSKSIIFSWDNYTDRNKILESIKENMKVLWFKPLYDEDEKMAEELDKEIDLFFSKREKKELKPVVKFKNKDKVSIKVLCWLPWSGKTTYYGNNFKKPFINFLANLSDSFNSYNSKLNSDFNFAEGYSNSYKKTDLDILMKTEDLRNFFYINLDYASIEYTTPSLFTSLRDYWKSSKKINSYLRDCLESNDKIKYVELILKEITPNIKEATDIIIDGLFIKKVEYKKLAKIFSKEKEITSVNFLMFDNNKELCLNNNNLRLKLQSGYEDDYKEKRADASSLINSLEYELPEEKDKQYIQEILPDKKVEFISLPVEKAIYNPFRGQFSEDPSSYKWRITPYLKQGIPAIDYENNYITSESWKTAGSHWGYDWTNYGDSEEEKKSDFSNLRKMMIEINKKTGNQIDARSIESFVDDTIENEEPIELDYFDPYTSCKSLAFRVSYQKVLDFFNDYDINLEDSLIDWWDFDISYYNRG